MTRLDLTTPAAARQFFETKLRQRQVNKVLHSFPSPRFWTGGAGTPLEARPLGSDAPSCELYVALPFCLTTAPAHCGYCLFPTEAYSNQDQLDVYLDYLAREGELYRERWLELQPRSVFIGGGTPNLLKAHQYPRLLGLIHDLLPALPAATAVTLEGIPQLFSREKLEVMQAHGVTRISMGAQQLDHQLSLLSGRKQQPKHVFQAVEWAAALGLGCNVDLIFGWPQQTMAHLERDLRGLMASGVEHITHYELNVGGATDFALNRREELPGPELVRDMYHLARELLTAGGYEQLTPYDFQKPNRQEQGESFVYEECRRTFDAHDVWGWGYAAISDFPDHRGPRDSPDQPGQNGGSTLMNARTLTAYYAALDAGRLPTEVGYTRTPADLRLSLLFRNLQSLSVDRASYRANFGQDVLEEFPGIWQAAADLGFVTLHDDALRLTPEGAYRVPLIQTALMQARVEELTDAHVAGLKQARQQQAAFQPLQPASSPSAAPS
ncbi:coproporphyrinogen-III oxidase family protein [Deinococcus sp. QL22]|uniref:coproporphyrinogen-III oxidase family protein n=1 Tax=Deinococcus sp. QL22 TaxID=2939437 RepID=UPI002016FADF|nr:coproporphyrinogen-III oxidase family protein [Deinococcus sp. QL22]UQN09210.1 coproporphyrinogen III oxidase family protein [Deinococcus sp. QL22]